MDMTLERALEVATTCLHEQARTARVSPETSARWLAAAAVVEHAQLWGELGRTRQPIAARDGWVHVGCPTCGLVTIWPEDRELVDVLCTHNPGAQLAAGRFAQGADPSWTAVVPVAVVAA